jgi:hypothetical protein
LRLTLESTVPWFFRRPALASSLRYELCRHQLLTWTVNSCDMCVTLLGLVSPDSRRFYQDIPNLGSIIRLQRRFSNDVHTSIYEKTPASLLLAVEQVHFGLRFRALGDVIYRARSIAKCAPDSKHPLPRGYCPG